MRVLLDPCTFLWIASGSPELSGAARELFRDPANDVFPSADSAWEISLKHALGKLPLPEPPAQFVPGAPEQHRIEPLAIDESSALTTNRLPPLHRDTFDRILYAQAIMQGLTVLTPDTVIQQYPVATAW